MSKTTKETVRSFYETKWIHNTKGLSEYLHPDIEVHWNSSFGFRKIGFSDIEDMFKEMGVSFETFRCEISHLLAEDNYVTVRYTYFGSTIENPGKEEVMGYFISIWELKEGKLYKGYQISHRDERAK